MGGHEPGFVWIGKVELELHLVFAHPHGGIAPVEIAPIIWGRMFFPWSFDVELYRASDLSLEDGLAAMIEDFQVAQSDKSTNS